MAPRRCSFNHEMRAYYTACAQNEKLPVKLNVLSARLREGMDGYCSILLEFSLPKAVYKARN